MGLDSASANMRQSSTRNGKTWRPKFLLLASAFLVIILCVLLLIRHRNVKGPVLQEEAACQKGRNCAKFHNSGERIISEAQQQCKEVCTSESCVVTASTILASMDLSMDPCQDFHSYICGHRAEDVFIPNIEGTITEVYLLSELMNMKLLQLIENTENSESSDSVAVKRKQLFDSCLNYVRSGDKHIEDFKSWFLNVGLPDWPLFPEDWSLSPRAFTRMLSKFLSAGENPLFYLGVNKKHMSNFSSNIFPNVPGMRTDNVGSDAVEAEFRGKYICPRDMEMYRNLSLAMLRSLGATQEQSQIVIDDMIEIHQKLYNHTDLQYSGRENESVDCSNPEIAMKNRWCIILKDHLEYLKSDLSLADVTVELTRCPEWFEFLDEFLKENSQRKIVNYMSLGFLVRMMEKVRSLFKSLPDIPGDPFQNCEARNGFKPLSDEGRCLNWISINFHQMLTADYVKQNDVEKRIEKVRDLLFRVSRAAVSLLESGTRLNEEERTSALNAVRYVDVESVFLAKYFTTEFNAEERFRHLHISESFVSNVISLLEFKVQERITYLEDWITEFRREKNPFSGQIFSGKLLYVSFTSLQPSFLDLDRPMYLDFGRMAAILGHEVTHNIYLNWRSTNSSMVMQEYQACVAEYYSQFEAPEWGFKLDGNNTVGENLADILGVQLAYKAYLSYIDEYGDEPSLPGVPFTGKQLFFISLGQAFCELGGDKNEFKIYIHNDHSPGLARVHGSLQNLQEFSDAFNCPKGSPMNPPKKCNLNF